MSRIRKREGRRNSEPYKKESGGETVSRIRKTATYLYRFSYRYPSIASQGRSTLIPPGREYTCGNSPHYCHHMGRPLKHSS